MPDPSIFFSITASVAESAVVNPKGTQTLLVNGMNTFFNNGKPTGINGLRKLRNLPSWLVIFLVVPFKKVLLFSKSSNYF